jgi:sulfur transfer complex TusBCD TusB component (DsrH family)
MASGLHKKESLYILRGFQLSIRRTVYPVLHDFDARGFTDEPQREIKKKEMHVS